MRVEIYIYELNMRVKCAKMWMSDKEMAPRVRQHPGTRPTERKPTVDKDILARAGRIVGVEHDHQGGEEQKSCFYCLEGWVFLGSLDHDGEEVVEAIRCRRCKGSGQISG
jgi:hypothetical protein